MFKGSAPWNSVTQLYDIHYERMDRINRIDRILKMRLPDSNTSVGSMACTKPKIYKISCKP